MRFIFFALFISSCLCSCGQSDTDTQHIKKSSNNDRVFDTMVTEVCNCATLTLKKDSVIYSIDSCFRLSVRRHFEQIAIDTSTVNGKLKMRNELNNKFWANNFRINCPIINSVLLSATENPNSNFFQGTLVKQELLASKKYKLFLRDAETKSLMEFVSENPIQDGLLKVALSGPNVIVEYERKSENDFTVKKVWVVQKDYKSR